MAAKQTNYLVRVFEKDDTAFSSFGPSGKFVENKAFETLTGAQRYMQEWAAKGFAVWNTYLGDRSDDFETPFG